MNHRQKHLSVRLLALAALLSMAPMQGAWAKPPPPPPSPVAPSLGTASNFGALGGAGVTCTSPLLALPNVTVTGDVGSGFLPGASSVTGFLGYGGADCSLSGIVYIAPNAVAVQAYNDIFATGYAYDTLAGMTCGTILPATPLGAVTLAPGVYCFDTTADLTGSVLTLKGGKNAVWVFQVGTGMTTGNTAVVMNGGSACNVFWETGTLAAIGTNTAFTGNILAGSSTTFTGPNASLVGRAFAKTGSVTMTGAAISKCGGKPPKS